MSGNTSEQSLCLVDIHDETTVDKEVVPAIIEFVAKNLVSKRRTKGVSFIPGCLVSIDRPVKRYESASRRGFLSQNSIVDFYSNWCSEWFSSEDSNARITSDGTHQSVQPKTSDTLIHKILTEVDQVFTRMSTSAADERVVILDSLSSVSSVSTDPHATIRLINAFRTWKNREGTICSGPTAIMAIIFRNHMGSSLCDHLQKLADTHVIVTQFSNEKKAVAGLESEGVRESVRLEVRKRKLSGRVHFEEFVGRMNWKDAELCDVITLDSRMADRGRHDQVREGADDAAQALAQQGLSFRVTLSSKEREVRAAAGLPYLHKNEELANSALELHPTHLQLRSNDNADLDAGDQTSSEDDEEDLFSEDV